MGPLALAPEIGREAVVGETSAAAEAYGVRAGLRLGEALARCPTLRLVAPDPAGVADAWERMIAALEGIGAAVESDHPGTAWFEERGLRGLHGGTAESVITAARRALAAATQSGKARGVVNQTFLGGDTRFGAGGAAGGTRFGAEARPAGTRGSGPAVQPAAARRSAETRGSPAVPRSRRRRAAVSSARFRRVPPRPAPGGSAPRPRASPRSPPRTGPVRARPEIAPDSPARLAAYLAPLPVSLLNARPEVAMLPEALERFGIATLGELAKLSRAQLADRFGTAGPIARDLARGKDTPLRPRVPSERLQEVLELPEATSGPQLERGLGMLIDRVLARPERRGRTVRAVVLSAALVGGGTWRTQMTFREALADPRRMRLAITGRLTELPAPADSLRLRVEAFGPPSGDQRSLLAEPAAIRRARLREAVRQTRAAAGPDAALRILAVDPDSRVPERRLALAPWEP